MEKIADGYFDGKCSPSRHVRIAVRGPIRITWLNKKQLRLWKKAINDDFKEALLGGCVIYVDGPQRFWDWNCDEFLIGNIVGDKDTIHDPMLFAKRPGGNWYCVNWNYMLDIKGEVRKENWENWQACAKERGQELKWNSKQHRFEYYKDGRIVEI